MNIATATAAWYVVRSKPRQERVALTNLENQGFATYLPYTSISKRIGGKWQSVREVLFPGYLFIRVNTAEQDISPVRSTLGVQGLVRFGQKLQPVPEALIAALMQQEQLLATAAGSGVPVFVPGQQVDIVEGPFEGLRAAFQLAKSVDRVKVLLNILGSEQPITLDVNQITPAK